MHHLLISLSVGMIERKRKNRVVVRAASHNQSLPNAISWVQVHLTSIGGTYAVVYYTGVGSDWFPQEAIVELVYLKFPCKD